MRIHHAAPRPRTLGESLIHRELAGLRVDPTDVLLTNVGEVSVVLGIGDHIIDVVTSRRLLERVPRFPFAGFQVNPVHGCKPVVLGP